MGGTLLCFRHDDIALTGWTASFQQRALQTFVHVRHTHVIVACFREDQGVLPQRNVGRGKSGEDHPGGDYWRESSWTWLRQEVLWLLGTVFCFDTPFGQFPKWRYLLQMLREASKIPELPNCYSEPSWIALIPQKNKTAKALSNSFTFFKVDCQISSLTSLKKLGTYRKPTDACINQITVFSNKWVTADTTMVCFIGQQSYTRLSSKASTQRVRRCYN